MRRLIAVIVAAAAALAVAAAVAFGGPAPSKPSARATALPGSQHARLLRDLRREANLLKLARPIGRVRNIARGPHIIVPNPGGRSCPVIMPQDVPSGACSAIPCTVFIGSAPAAVVTPSITAVRPASCGGRRTPPPRALPVAVR